MSASMIAILTMVGNLVLMGTVIFISIRKGTTQADQEVISLREKQVSAMRDEITRQNTIIKEQDEKINKEVKEMASRIGELNGLLTAKETEIKRLTDLVTNKNPEMENFFKQASITLPLITDLQKFMCDIVPILNKIDEHLSSSIHLKKDNGK